jgi:hypothetical protein
MKYRIRSRVGCLVTQAAGHLGVVERTGIRVCPASLSARDEVELSKEELLFAPRVVQITDWHD